MKEEIDMGQVPSAQDVHDERSKRQVVDNMPEVRELKRKVNRMRLELDNCEEGSQAEKELISKIKAANQQIRDYYDRPLNLRSLLGMNESKTNKNMKKNVVKINENTLRQIVAESIKQVLMEDAYDFKWNNGYDSYVLVDDSCDAVIQNYTSAVGYDAKADAINDAKKKARETRGGSFSVFGCADGMYDEDSLVYCTSGDRNSWKI